VDHEDVAPVEPRQDVLAPFDPGDPLADEPVRELLPVVVPADRTHAVGIDRLGALADYLPFESRERPTSGNSGIVFPPVGTLRPLS
jgi:hypothetical protein